MSNEVVLAMEQVIFAVKETTKGVVAFPSAAAEMIVGTGGVEINQQPTYTNSDEIVNSLDVVNRFRDQVSEGSFSLPSYIRPSGSAGTQPMSKVLYESLMGVETVSASTSVTYSQATTKPSFTLWVKKGDVVKFGRGACCTKAALNLTNKGGAAIDFSGGFLQMGWAGVSAVNGAVSSSTSVTVDNAKLFTADARVQIGSDDNSGDGYIVNSVDVDTNILTLADPVTCSDDAVIKGFLPTYTAVGSPLENKDTEIKFNGVAKNLKSFSLEISSPVKFLTDEITTSGYADDYVEDTRSITGKLNVLERTDDLAYFYDGLNDDDVVTKLTIGDSAGSIFVINLLYSRLDVPSESTEKPTMSLDIGLTALGSSGEDSCTMVFT